MDTILYRTLDGALSWETSEIWDCRRSATRIQIDEGLLSEGTARRILPRTAEAESEVAREEQLRRAEGFRELTQVELAELLTSAGIELTLLDFAAEASSRD